MREHVPLAARLVLVEDGVEHLASIDGPGSTTLFGWRDQRLQDNPLLVRQVGLVDLARLLQRLPCTPVQNRRKSPSSYML